MSSRKQSESDKEKSEGRTQRHALLLIWGIIGALGLVLILYGQLQRRRASASVDWPVVPGKIVTSEVTSHTDEDGTTYSADIECLYGRGDRASLGCRGVRWTPVWRVGGRLPLPARQDRSGSVRPWQGRPCCVGSWR